MFKSVSWYFTVFAVCMLSAACARDVDLRPEGKGMLVVGCILTENQTQHLRLSLTDIASEESRTSLLESDIRLYDETADCLAGIFHPDVGDDWVMDYSAVPTHSYRLEIFPPDRDRVIARTTMPESVRVYFEIVPIDILNAGKGRSLVFESVIERQDKDIPNETGVLFKIESLPDGPVWIMGMDYDIMTGSHVLSEKITTDLMSVDPFNATGESFQHDQFFEHPSFVDYSSLAGGLVYCFYRELDSRPIYKRYIRVPSLSENPDRTTVSRNSFFSVAGSFSGDYLFADSPSDTNGYLLFMFPSKEYDCFVKEVFIKKTADEATEDYSSLFSRNNVYSNIENGIGIFGACTYQRLPWNKEPLPSYRWDSLFSPK